MGKDKRDIYQILVISTSGYRLDISFYRSKKVGQSFILTGTTFLKVNFIGSIRKKCFDWYYILALYTFRSVLSLDVNL